MKGRNWAQVVSKEAVAPTAAASFVLFQLMDDFRWKPVDDVSVKELIAGPFVARIGDNYFGGNEEVCAKLEGKRLEWAFQLVDKLSEGLIQAGLSPADLLAMSFRALLANYLAVGILGGKFITNKIQAVNGCQQTQISIPL